MSDESQPPALRLKPRLRTGNEPAPAAPAAAPGAPASELAGGAAGPKSGSPLPPAPGPWSTIPATLPPPPPPAAAAAETPDGGAATELRVRLKPRIGVSPPPPQPAAAVEATPMSAIPAAPTGENAAPPGAVAASSSEPPALSLPPIGVIPPVEPSAPLPPPAALAAEAAAKFKLKPKAPALVPPAIIAPAAPATGATELPLAKPATLSPPPPLVPVVVGARPPPVDAPPPAKPPGVPHVPHIRAPGEEMPLSEPRRPAVIPPKRPRPSKTGLIAVLVAVGGIVVLAAYFVWRPSSGPPPAPKVATKPAVSPADQGANAAASKAMKDAATPEPAATTTAVPGPTPSETLNEIAAAPKQAIDKARDVVAARRGNEQARIDAMSAGEEAPDKRALDTPPPSRFADRTPSPAVAATPAPVAGSAALIAPGVVATSNDVVAAPKASAAFTRFVADARITGVFQGTPPRALINGRTIRAGEMVDKALGIVFDSIDAEKKTITFKDRAGVPATRKY